MDAKAEAEFTDFVHGNWARLVRLGSPVSYLTVRLADGQTVRVPVVKVGGERLYGLVIARSQRIVSWSAFDSAGRRLDGGDGPPGG